MNDPSRISEKCVYIGLSEQKKPIALIAIRICIDRIYLHNTANWYICYLHLKSGSPHSTAFPHSINKRDKKVGPRCHWKLIEYKYFYFETLKNARSVRNKVEWMHDIDLFVCGEYFMSNRCIWFRMCPMENVETVM